MKLFISDFHIGSPLFIGKNKIIELFNNKDIDEIYILGDVIDSWEGNVDNIVRENKGLIDFINNCNKVILVLKGNHDPSLKKMREIFNKKIVTTEFEINISGKKALLVHGDSYDGYQWLHKLMFPIQFISERMGFNFKAFIRNTYHRFKVWMKNTEYNSLILRVEKKLVDRLEARCDIIVAGHTHLYKDVELPEIRYINCGCLVYKPSYITIGNNVVNMEEI